MDNPNTAGLRGWRPLVACPHPELADCLRDALEAIGIRDFTRLHDYPGPGAVAALAEQHRANILFLDVCSNYERALTVLAEAVPTLPVVALNPVNDADLILRCLRREVSEFLFGDVTPGQVQSALERVARLRSATGARKAGSICSVVPGKVGCGASTVAAHLALALHARGGADVLLVDADSLAGSISFLLKLKSEFTLENAVRDWGRMDLEMWSRMAAKAGGIDVLPSPESVSRLEIDKSLAHDLTAFCREHYDMTVFDTGGAASASAIWLSQAADHVVLVATNELASLHATRRAIERLEASGVARALLRVVVNRYAPSSGFKLSEVSTALRLPIYADLANDYEGAQSALLEGRPVASDSRLGVSIAALADRLLGRADGHRPRAQASPRLAPLLSFFSRRA